MWDNLIAAIMPELDSYTELCSKKGQALTICEAESSHHQVRMATVGKVTLEKANKEISYVFGGNNIDAREDLRRRITSVVNEHIAECTKTAKTLAGQLLEKNQALDLCKAQLPCPTTDCPKSNCTEKAAELKLCNDDKGTCSKRLTECQSENSELGNSQLFSSSFLSGAVYSLIPEMIRDGIEYTGYPELSNIAETVVQGGIILYNTEYYVPVIAGVAVRTIAAKCLGCSPQTSTTLGSTAAVLFSVVPALIFSQETALDCIVNCSLAVGGSYAGSTVALKAKSWIYDKWNYYNSNKKEGLLVAKIEKLEKEVEELKKERKTLYSLTSESVETSKNK
jgi:hypothetical protein